MVDINQAYYLHTDSFTYHAHLKIMFRGADEILSAGLSIGDVRRGRVNMTFYPLNNDTLHISGIDYSDVSRDASNEKCATSGSLPRGTGTKHMVQTAISFMLSHPTFGSSIKHITLDDASSVPCKFKDRVTNVSLMFSYIALNGKTWYQARFNAFVQNECLRKQYDECILQLKDPGFKNNIQVDHMRGRMLLDGSDPGDVDALCLLFNGSKTIQEFFQNIKKEYGDRFCVITYRWLDRFIDEVVLKSCINGMTKWELPILPLATRISIDAKKTNDLPIDVFPIKGGAAERIRLDRSSYGNYHARYGW